MITQNDRFANYQRIKCIGKGAFGTATLYHKLSTNTEVVIKEIFLSDMTELEKQLAFNEVEVLASLDHTNIIRSSYVTTRVITNSIFRYMGNFEKDGSLFIEMEYANSGNLAQLINSRKERNYPFKEADIVDIMMQITSGISYMHSCKILHRDLKTANIFLNRNSSLKIGDFGISKIMTTRIQAQTVVGTPYYLSPEMCEGQEYDEKSDVWAVGCILYELAKFHKPFEATTLPMLVNKISACEYEDLDDSYSVYLRQLVKDILQKDFVSRPSASEINAVRLPQILSLVIGQSNKNTSLTPINMIYERSVLYQLSSFGDNISMTPVELPNKKIISLSASQTHCIAVTFGICAAGENFSTFLSKDGLVYSCGDGRKGCLGHNSWHSVLRPTIIQSLLTQSIAQIQCGSNHVLALAADGKVFSWGSSSHGQLGLGDKKFCFTPTVVDVNGDQLIKKIFASYNSSALLDSNGSLFACGDNVYKKLGFDNQSKITHFQQLKHIQDKVDSFNIGETHSIIITKSKSTIALGRNNEGQLGIGHCKPCVIPQRLELPSGATMVACGESYTAVGINTNALYLWGTYLKVICTQSHEKTGEIIESKVSEQTLQPRCILALYSSEERLKAGHKIWLGSIISIPCNLLVLVHTTAPPPLKKPEGDKEEKYGDKTKYFSNWMDTNVDYSSQTTLPNTPQFT
ncbi:hypothetical protein PPYR_05263 [Photinus pyralis]|uniref:non-specific serine/threonine protein kinase n=1 Tax=Photinus pyralis TaxID=7054 RepID=A0A5N4AUB8_PHOPY|nr:hypothetical protein PPYR_05263 [Photinus pyralis]